MLRKMKVLLVVLVVMLIAFSTYAFAAANTIAPNSAGYKASAVSGYAITNIVYDLNTADPTLLDKIIFDIAPIDAVNGAPPVTVMISTTAPGSQDFTTSTCVISGAGPYVSTCSFTAPIPVIGVVALDVVATSSTDP